MTPEELQEIYINGCNVEYQRHRANYDPVNQNKVTLAGFAAVQDAVKSEMTAELASQYLNNQGSTP